MQFQQPERLAVLPQRIDALAEELKAFQQPERLAVLPRVQVGYMEPEVEVSTA